MLCGIHGIPDPQSSGPASGPKLDPAAVPSWSTRYSIPPLHPPLSPQHPPGALARRICLCFALLPDPAACNDFQLLFLCPHPTLSLFSSPFFLSIRIIHGSRQPLSQPPAAGFLNTYQTVPHLCCPLLSPRQPMKSRTVCVFHLSIPSTWYIVWYIMRIQ